MKLLLITLAMFSALADTDPGMKRDARTTSPVVGVRFDTNLVYVGAIPFPVLTWTNLSMEPTLVVERRRGGVFVAVTNHWDVFTFKPINDGMVITTTNRVEILQVDGKTTLRILK